MTCKVTPKFVSFCYLYNKQGKTIQYVEGFALQKSIIVLFEQMKSGDFKDKSGKISD
jgi:thioredoxin-related protein